MAIFTHVAIGTNDITKARAFYDSVLGPLGYKRVGDFGDGGSAWGETAPEFFVLKPTASPRHSPMAVPSALWRQTGPRSQPSTRPHSPPAARMRARSARGPGIPMPTVPMPAISRATSSRSIA